MSQSMLAAAGDDQSVMEAGSSSRSSTGIRSDRLLLLMEEEVEEEVRRASNVGAGPSLERSTTKGGGGGEAAIKVVVPTTNRRTRGPKRIAALRAGTETGEEHRQQQQQHYSPADPLLLLINGNSDTICTVEQQQPAGQEEEAEALPSLPTSFATTMDRNGNRSLWNRQGVLVTMFLTFLLLTGCMALFNSLLDNAEDEEQQRGDNALEEWTNEDAKNYLNQFGYIGQSRAGQADQAGGHLLQAQPEHRTADRLLEDFSLESLKSAIRQFQEFAGLPATGELDNRTKKKMKQPRCGLQDVLMLRGRGESSVFKWRKRHLTYRIESFSSDLPNYMQEKAVQMAFDTWARHIPMDFSKASSYQQPDVRVRFARRSHGDPWPFDGKGGVLAHATFPSDGQLHFDDDEQWAFMDAAKISSYRYTDLFWVALHEIGHVLGLSHSKVETAIMAPFYRDADDMVDWRGNYKSPELTSDDIRAANEIYGRRTSGNGNGGSRSVGGTTGRGGEGGQQQERTNSNTNNRQQTPSPRRGNNNAGGDGVYDDRQGGFWNRLGKFFGQNDEEEEEEQQQPAGHWRSQQARNDHNGRGGGEEEEGHRTSSGWSGKSGGGRSGSHDNRDRQQQQQRNGEEGEEEEEVGVFSGYFSSAATATTSTMPSVLIGILLMILLSLHVAAFLSLQSAVVL